MTIFHIRLAKDEDLKELSFVCRKTFIDTYRGKGKDRPDEMVYEYVEEKFNECALASEIKDPSVKFYVGVSDNKIVGYLKLIDEEPPCFVNEKNLIHLERIYLLHEHHGKGFGKELLSKAENVALESHRGIWLGVWDENQEAIAFYLKHGFHKSGSHNWEFDYKDFHYVDTDDVLIKIMSK